LLTALLLGGLVVGMTLCLPTAWFGGLLLVVILIGAWEWSGLLFPTVGRLAYVALVAGLGLVIVGWLQRGGLPAAALGLVVAFWCYVGVWLWRYGHQQRHDPLPVWALAGLLTLLPPWLVLLELHRQPGFGPGYALFLLLLVWLADSSAYFAGRRWGRYKLAPTVSPGKTREGAVGALLTTLTVAGIGAVLLRIGTWPAFILVCLVTVIFSIVGDLFESMLKRQHNAKDSGALLPGHGGVLDRIDSMTAAAPVFLLGLRLIGADGSGG
jgi:phosphatidate cytidylyltransferase